MGQRMSFGLTQLDVEELIDYCDGALNQQELEALYKRFRRLDKDRKGYISSEEFLSIPELSINPLAQRLSFLVEGINFRDFAKLVSVFSPRAPREQKLKLMFDVYDYDGDGFISEEDMAQTLRYLVGSTLTDEQVHSIIQKVMAAAHADSRGLTFKQYQSALSDAQINMTVEIPAADGS